MTFLLDDHAFEIRCTSGDVAYADDPVAGAFALS